MIEKKVEKKYQQAIECPITTFMEQIGGKWKPVIIWLLLENKVMRFSELDKAMHGISQKILSQQLKELENHAYTLIDSRVEGAPRKVVNRNSQLKTNSYYRNKRRNL